MGLGKPTPASGISGGLIRPYQTSGGVSASTMFFVVKQMKYDSANTPNTRVNVDIYLTSKLAQAGNPPLETIAFSFAQTFVTGGKTPSDHGLKQAYDALKALTTVSQIGYNQGDNKSISGDDGNWADA